MLQSSLQFNKFTEHNKKITFLANENPTNQPITSNDYEKKKKFSTTNYVELA